MSASMGKSPEKTVAAGVADEGDVEGEDDMRE